MTTREFPQAEGSCRIQCGGTVVLCAATVSSEVPAFLTGTGSGWVTARYGMLPRSTKERHPRPEERRSPDARALEIGRLVGRSLRAAAEVGYLNGHTVTIDCDVLGADGGTRTASVTGGMVALAEALVWMKRKGIIPGVPLKTFVAGVSVGVVGGELALDLDYELDRRAEVDMNVVMTEGGELVEIQGTAEARPFDVPRLTEMVELARGGIEELVRLQKAALGEKALKELEGR